ncbi:hypothetical protein [Nocardioides baculatus]|uniref:Uncharacterized protein n=1 Tax=Nocardioides baculatus TaxID=2801337 RepID=A0ABS1L2N8_9ACTN|nr:hypothetical protein [Nocardioides baculatus]MBL0745979.1 hypothetical protein [Nocardioides baculatus]
MTTLILIGYWKSEQQPQLPDPRRFVDPSWDRDERDLVAGYLRGGLPVVHMMGHSPCRMCSSQQNGVSELTNGGYLWPEGFAHYVADHEVRLPDEFVQHAIGRFADLEQAAGRASNGAVDAWLATVE